MNLCSCGCGEECKQRFVYGHNRRGYSHSEETRRKISVSNRGQICSEETRKKIGDAHRGLKLSEEHKAKIGLAQKGKPKSESWKKAISLSKAVISQETRKKLSEALKGRKCSEETRRKMGLNNGMKSPEARKKMSLVHKGKKLNENHRKAISDSLKGHRNWMPKTMAPCSEERKRKISEANKGKIPWLKGLTKETDERVRKLVLSNSGPNSCHWKGGISNEPYCDAWADREYKQDILERDNRQCQNPNCGGKVKKLMPHHIDYNKKNCRPDNLITLCNSCNSRANFNREYWEEFFLNLMKVKISANG